jgi:hypothetical protein
LLPAFGATEAGDALPEPFQRLLARRETASSARVFWMAFAMEFSWLASLPKIRAAPGRLSLTLGQLLSQTTP